MNSSSDLHFRPLSHVRNYIICLSLQCKLEEAHEKRQHGDCKPDGYSFSTIQVEIKAILIVH